MEFVVGWETEAIRAVDEVEQLPLEDGRILRRMRLMPLGGDDDELRADES